jgi:hypothetical protein
MCRIGHVLMSAIALLLLAAVQAGAAQITVAWDRNPEPDVTGYIVQYGPSSAPFTQSADAGNATTWTFGSALAGTTYSFRVVAYNAGGERSDPSGAVTAVADPSGLPTLVADRTVLNFGIIGGSPQIKTASQAVRLTKSGAGTVTWTASSSASWLQVSPASGSGSGVLTAALVTGAVPASGSASATITIATTGAGNTIAPVAVSVRVIPSQSRTAPVGTVDTPTDNVTGVTGSLAMTGWAVDDVDVTRVRILRDPVGAEPAGQLMFVGDATLVEDARPDIFAAYPLLPQSVRAGWGYLLLTNMLPGLGNGTYRLYAYADDADGHTTLLGTRTVTCANNSATHPFGAIDTPTPGQTVSGNATAFGWVLSRGPRRADVPGGGSVSVVINGAFVGSPSGWTSRSDLSALFPAAQYPGIGSAMAAYGFDTTTLANGVHTIAWVVTDNMGNASGVGSRYFRVFNASASQTAALTAASTMHADDVSAAVLDGSAIEARRGYSLDVPFRRYEAGPDGRVTIQSEELDRIEMKTNGATAGYLVTAAGLRPLPIGSTLDASTGDFVWQPGVGFVGSYDLAFVGTRGGRATRQDVRVVLHSKGSNRVGPQVVVDIAPRPGAGQIVAGWAADLDAHDGTGIDTIHVWAYPRAGGDPMFVGEASIGGARPDVAAVYGDRFLNSGYGLRVKGLDAGTYDLAVFAWSTAKRGWLPAKVVAIEIK